MAPSRTNSQNRKRGGVFMAFGTFAVFIAVGVLAFGEVFTGLMAGGVAFAVHRQLVVRIWLLAHHTRGVDLSRAKKPAAALEAFQKSEADWARRRLLDRWRAPLLASASRWGFADQARYNQALCLYQLGRTAEAMPILRALLDREPSMGMARALLEHIESVDGEAPPVESWDHLAADLEDSSP